MQDRIRFIDHQGKEILLVDLSNCPANEVEEIARSVPDYTAVQYGRVVRSQISLEQHLIGMQFGPLRRPLSSTSLSPALVGTEGLPVSFYDELKTFSRRELLPFKTREEALAWLAAA